MTSLKHGVNLSRRACRRFLTVLTVAAFLAVTSSNPIENKSSYEGQYSRDKQGHTGYASS
ncbi:hypothetical protein RR46_09180 [Papilio xuthus]|uniref:Uncharacterized protein n=1 Tax=Papilio xuthus TaxID=66420 RepID=A0A194PW94_PAPXU|nr:hypothetical protein RR46_09180 [Papilio xuthus]